MIRFTDTMNIMILLSIIFVAFFSIQSVVGLNNINWANDMHKNHTVNEPNGIRFQRILHRKKRFLLFPPGSAIVVSVTQKLRFSTITNENGLSKQLFSQLFGF